MPLKSRAHLHILICSFMFMTACKVSNPSVTVEPMLQNDEIVFLLFKITNDTIQNKNAIILSGKSHSSGKLKKEPASNLTADNILSLSIYQQGSRTDSFVIKHPLYKRIEYLDGNELTAKSIKVNSDEFFIRFQQSDPHAIIKIYEKLWNQPQTTLTEVKL